jgi:hypothetical protein
VTASFDDDDGDDDDDDVKTSYFTHATYPIHLTLNLISHEIICKNANRLVTVVALSKARDVFVRSKSGISGSNPTPDMDVFVLPYLCCPV